MLERRDVPTDVTILGDAEQSAADVVQIGDFKWDVVGPTATSSQGLHST